MVSVIILTVLAGVWIPQASAQDNFTDPNVTDNELLVYENPIEGIGKIQYPENWSVGEKYGNATTSIQFASPPENSSDEFPEGLTITVMLLPVPPNATLTQERFERSLLDQLLNTTNSEFQVVESDFGSKTLTSAKYPAFRTIFTSTQPSVTEGNTNTISPVELELKVLAISIIENDELLYTLIYMAEEAKYSTYLPTVQKMIDSFETTASKEASAQNGPSGAGVTNQTNTTTSPTSGCLIATAAFGSELTPQVQFLRNFRDNHILSTTAGSSFMNVFNTWYYSFSPSVADYEREQPWLQQTVKTAIYPLLGILGVSEKAYSVMPGNAGALLAGLTASALIGAVYFSPMALALKKVKVSYKFNYKLAVLSLGSISFAFALTTILSADATVLMASSAGFVLATLSLGAILTTMLLSKAVKRIQSARLQNKQ